MSMSGRNSLIFSAESRMRWWMSLYVMCWCLGAAISTSACGESKNAAQRKKGVYGRGKGEDDSKICGWLRDGQALLLKSRKVYRICPRSSRRSRSPPGSLPRALRARSDLLATTMPDPPAASSSSSTTPKAIPNLAKRASETTRGGASRLVFLPTKPAARRKE